MRRTAATIAATVTLATAGTAVAVGTDFGTDTPFTVTLTGDVHAMVELAPDEFATMCQSYTRLHEIATITPDLRVIVEPARYPNRFSMLDGWMVANTEGLLGMRFTDDARDLFLTLLNECVEP